MNLEQTAKEVESKLHYEFLGDDGFRLLKSQLYGVIVSDEGVNFTLVNENSDVYDLLNDPSNKAMNGAFDFVTVVTTGWAAPLNENGEPDGAPSHHPERRRVRLSIVANRDFIANVLRFQDEPDDTVVDLGEAQGTLAEAIADFLR